MTTLPGSEAGPGETRLVRFINAFYKRWAYFIADHPVAIIVICTIITLIGTAKIITTPNENDIQGWAPYGARARDELAMATEFFGNGIAIFTLVLPLHGKDALDTDVLQEARRVEFVLTHNFTMYNKDTNQNETYQEFCYSFCQINDPFIMFTDALMMQRNLSAKGSPLVERLDLQYPVATLYDRKINIQPSFFGLTLANETDGGLTNMKSSKLLAIHFRAERKRSWTTQQVKDFEMTVTNYFEKEFKSDTIRVLTLSTSYVEAEVVRAGMSMLPFLIVGFGIMAVVSSITTTLSALYMGQMSIHKLSLALVACICPFMACGTALGAIFFLGVRFGSILCVTPFLVLAIGVDDAYLMNHAWQRVTQHRKINPVKDDSPASRLAEVLADTGPAIMISALTNILADTVGTFTGNPECTLLAYGNMSCIFVDFIYQITFYSAVMIITGHFEMNSEKEKNFTQRICCGGDDEKSSIDSSSTGQSLQEKINGCGGRCLDLYLDIVCNKVFDVLMLVLWAVFIGFAIYGITKMPINLTPKKLFAADSPLIEMDNLRVEYVIPTFTLATLFVNNPGNLSDPKRLRSLNNFVEEMEHLPGAWGAQSSNYFMRDFLEYEKTKREEEAEFEDEMDETSALLGSNATERIRPSEIDTFIQWPEYEHWRGFVRMVHAKNDTKEPELTKFFLTTAYKGEELRDWVNRDAALKRWRNVVDKPLFNISVFSDDGIYLDLIDNMPTDTWQAAVATLGCMTLICIIFMWDGFTVVAATIVIASVMTGILGLLSLTGTDLDPIVMAALIISIGFSVDIPAHVSYHYHTAGKALDARERLRVCLSSVGFPAIQASISTSLCVLALKCVQIYMSHVFVKTMILCMTLCVIHGLLLIPCMASLLEPMLARLRRN